MVLGVWDIGDLVSSNNNLENIDQCRDEGYVVGGLYFKHFMHLLLSRFQMGESKKVSVEEL